jgi:hypothetical protein
METSSAAYATFARGRRVLSRPVPWASAMVGLALAAAACGGGGAKTAGVASVGQATSTTLSAPANSSGATSYQKALAYAQCMRKNGVPDFPDPNGQGKFMFKQGPGLVGPGSPQFLTAQQACKSLAPAPPNPAQQNAFLAQALKFTKCMRAHGVPNFPDPEQRNGGVFFGGGAVNPNSPQFQTAQQECRSFLSSPGGGSGPVLFGGPPGH